MMKMGRFSGVGLVLAMAVAVPLGDAAAASERIQNLAASCYQCHGPGGVSVIPTRPNIGGQNAAYLALQLMRFKKGAEAAPSAETAGTARLDPVMSHMAVQVAYDDISPLALFLSQQPCTGNEPAQTETAPPKSPPALVQRCATCHGTNGIATKPSIPNLAGQQRAYLRRELLMLREMGWGTDSAEGWRNHPIMERQTARLKIIEVDALANYYASLSCDGGS